MHRAWLAGWILLMAPIACRAVEIYTDIPTTIHPDERYVFYSHGLIVEGDDEKPVSPRYGLYDFPAIKQALFEGGGFNLIAYHRPRDADIGAHATMLEWWVRKLVQAGVPPSHITLIGFSRGGQITAHASSGLRDLGINTAILAICSKGDVVGHPSLVLGGRLFTIYETTDEMGSCEKLGRRGKLASFEEISITTGRQHGAFFQPLPQWLTPLKDWIARTNR
jgi:hypothetical protein